LIILDRGPSTAGFSKIVTRIPRAVLDPPAFVPVALVAAIEPACALAPVFTSAFVSALAFAGRKGEAARRAREFKPASKPALDALALSSTGKRSSELLSAT
jgi:hypothetical protein